MCPPQTQVKEQQLPLEIETAIVEFDSVQECADWLCSRAKFHEIDAERIADIEAIGRCDEQSRTRIERYCAEMGLQSKYLSWPNKS